MKEQNPLSASEKIAARNYIKLSELFCPRSITTITIKLKVTYCNLGVQRSRYLIIHHLPTECKQFESLYWNPKTHSSAEFFRINDTFSDKRPEYYIASLLHKVLCGKKQIWYKPISPKHKGLLTVENLTTLGLDTRETSMLDYLGIKHD